jgi:hypothetical protein
MQLELYLASSRILLHTYGCLQDCILINGEDQWRHTEPESYKNAWLVTRRTLQAWVSAAAGHAPV